MKRRPSPPPVTTRTHEAVPTKIGVRRRSTKRVGTSLPFAVLAVVLLLWGSITAFVFLGHDDVAVASGRSSALRRAQGRHRNRDTVAAPPRTDAVAHDAVAHAAASDRIVDVLLALARTPSADLRAAFEGHDGAPFSLSELRRGACPSDDLAWLPRRPPAAAAELFRAQQEEHARRTRQPPRQRNGPVVAVYYEHLSKAGGTSFCKLAQSNMPRRDVPSYYCMPSDKKSVDARVGSWSLDKLADYFHTQPHRLVSNEWEPFNQEFLKLQMSFKATDETTITANINNEDIYLLFLTTIRNPINRILSAYKFWGVLNNPSKTKPTLELFLQRQAARANRWRILSLDITGNVGRFNFATWKFGGGTLPVTEVQKKAGTNFGDETHLRRSATAVRTAYREREGDWRPSFEKAVRTLTEFDLVVPMELLSEHPEPLRDLLGWKNFANDHVVNIGKVVNNDASSELSPALYEVLWEANKLDFILYYWTCAVYLARLHCSSNGGTDGGADVI